MPFALYVALRYLRSDRAQSALVLAAVSVGVCVVVFLSALIASLQASLIEKTLGSQPHVTASVPSEAPRALVGATPEVAIARTVQKSSQRLRSIDEWPERMRTFERVPGVVAVSPTVVGSGYAERGSAKRPIMVRGIDVERYPAILDLPKRLVAGRYEVTGAMVLLGSALAKDLGAAVGEKVRVVTPEGLDDTMTVAGIFELGNKGADGTWAFTSLREAQSLYALPGGVTVLEAKVSDVFEAEHVAEELRRRVPLTVESWMTLNAELLAGLAAQSSSKSMIQFFVVVAVALGIASVLIVSVVQKSKEIGILRAVGTPAHRVLQVFLIQGGILGLLGSFVGSALGAGFALFFGTIAVDEKGAPRFPITLTFDLFAGATLLATTVGLLSAYLPARRAARLDPATAIRHG